MLKKRVILTWLVVALLAVAATPAMASDASRSELGIWNWLEGMASTILNFDEPTPQVEEDGEPDPATSEAGPLPEPHG